MKKLLLCATIAVAMCFASCEGFDASEILDRLDNLENQLDDLKNNEENNQGGDNSNNPGGGDDIPADKTQAITFADPTTKLICILHWDENEDGELSYEEAAAVTDLGTAFKGSSILAFTELKYFTSLEKIADNAFEGCVSLVKITLPEQITTIGTAAFNGCTNLKKIAIPNAVTEIGDHAFNGCSSLTSVTIGNSVTSIGEYAFKDCTSLTSVDISDLSVWCKISFGYNTNPLCNGAKLYLNGSELTDITIPSDITEIKDYAFNGCTSLTSVTIPDSVTSMGYAAFRNCTSLASVTIPGSVTSIGDYAFYDCTSLTSVTIPDSVTSMGRSAFEGCTGKLTINCNIPPSEYANTTPFYNSKFTEVIIGDSVTLVGWYAFYNCTSLKEVYCKPTTPPTGSPSMFVGNVSGRKIYVPRNSVEAYKTAQYWNDYADDIVGYDFE